MGFLIGIVNALLAVILVVQYRLNRDRGFSGVGWWALGQTIVALGLAGSVAREASGAGRVAIPGYQTLLLVGTALILVGLLRFMGRRERSGWLVALMAAFVVWSSFFTFGVDSIVVRSVTFYVAIAGLYAVIVWALVRYALPAFRVTARATAVVFALGAAVYLMLALVWVVQPLIRSGVSPSSPVAAIAYLASLSATVLWTFGLVAMVNQRLAAEVAVEARNMHSVFSTGPDCAIISRLDDGAIDDVNDGFTVLTGYARDEAVGRTTIDLGLWVEPDQRRQYVERIAAEGALTDFPTVMRRKDGTTFDCMLSSSSLTLDDQPYMITVARDVTAQRRTEAQLHHEATTDSLTELPNRRHFLTSCEHELRRSVRSGRPLAVALVDIDRFKAINDTYGHAAGDAAIVAFASVIRGQVRDVDTLGRLGGDEFGLVFPDADLASAAAALERVRQALAATQVGAEGRDVAMTLSAGVTVRVRDDDTVDSLLARADSALYAAKERGRDRVVAVDGS